MLVDLLQALQGTWQDPCLKILCKIHACESSTQPVDQENNKVNATYKLKLDDGWPESGQMKF